MRRFTRKLDDVIFGPETGARLLVVHTGLAALIGVRIVLGPYRPLAGIPDALWDPVPILGFLGAAPSAGLIAAVQILGGLAALAAVLRKQPRLAFGLAWLCYLVLAGIRGSRGKVLHNDLLLLWVAVPFLLAPVQVALTDRTPRRSTGWPIRSAIAIGAVIYFLAGYHKIRRSGLDWAIGDNVRYVMLWGPAIGQAKWDSLARWVAERDWASRGTGALILSFELSFPLALVWRRLLPAYAAVAVALHVTTYLFLGLDYWAWALTASLLFIDWPAIAGSRVRRRTVRGTGADSG